jgi:hypothetical protein
MKKISTAALATTMCACALALAPQASADFDRSAYLRCMASDAMSVGGVPLDSSTLAKIGAQAYGVSDPDSQAATTLAQRWKLSPSLMGLILRCANPSNG